MRFSKSFFLAIGHMFLVANLLLASSISAFAEQPWTAVIRNEGLNSEYIERFVLNENSKQPIGDNKTLMSMVKAFESGQESDALNAANLAAWSSFNEILFIGGSASTLAEQALFVDGLSGINTAMTNIGLLLGGAQVLLDINSGDTPAALVNSYKTMQSFIIGRLGTRIMQIGGVFAASVDYFLTYVRTSSWQAFEDKIGISYKAYYSNDDYANVRSINEWKIRVHEIYEDSLYAANNSKMDNFKNKLDAEIRSYAKRFWQDLDAGGLDSLVEMSDRNFFFNTDPVVTQEYRDRIEAKFRADLMKQLIKRVFPEIAQRAWKNLARDQVYAMNGAYREGFNRTYTLEISAKDLAEDAEFRVHRNRGKYWRGVLTPDKSSKVKITRLAYLKAGFPTRVTLHVGEEVLEASYAFRDGHAEVVFAPTPVEDTGIDWDKLIKGIEDAIPKTKSVATTICDQDGCRPASAPDEPKSNLNPDDYYFPPDDTEDPVKR